MPDNLFTSVLTVSSSGAVTPGSFLLCSTGTLMLGLLTAFIHMYKNRYTKSFVVTLALLPMIVQMVIMMVNGNVGTGVAVAGAFSLIRFRSVPGTAREIGSIFLAMALGLAAGMGYLAIALVFLALYGLACMLYTRLGLGGRDEGDQLLKIVIPETLDYSTVFDDLFEKYTERHELQRTRTTDLGSLYQLVYKVRMKNGVKEKDFLDDIRCRNGNLDLQLGRVTDSGLEL